MLKRIVTLVATLTIAISVGLIVFLAGMRAKSPRVLNAVRRVNRAFFNPRQMQSAGTAGAYASVIQHRGRTSGRAYETPVGAVATDDGFMIALVYGSHTDWLENVLASRSATIVHEGRTYHVDHPEVVSMEEAAADFPAKDQRSLRVFAVDRCLRVRRVEPDMPEGVAATP